MSPATEAPNPPVARKVIYGVLAYAVAVVLQKIAPGYHPDAFVEQIVSGAVGYGTSFLYREQLDYLVPALRKAEEVTEPYQR